MDSGSTSKYIDARECAARGSKIEVEDQPEQLKMADGTVVQMEGRIQFVLKCGGYRGKISARGFSQYEQTNDSGNPVAIIGEPPH